MKWVTRKGVKFDRTACAWAIKRFIDPDAEFDFLSGDDAMNAAIAGGAKAFHNYVFTGRVEDLPAERVNFPKLLSMYDLYKDPALPIMAETAKKAEMVGWQKDGTEHYSLWAIANGIASIFGGDDAGITERMMPVYDALYAYCKLRAVGSSGWTGDT